MVSRLFVFLLFVILTTAASRSHLGAKNNSGLNTTGSGNGRQNQNAFLINGGVRQKQLNGTNHYLPPPSPVHHDKETGNATRSKPSVNKNGSAYNKISQQNPPANNTQVRRGKPFAGGRP